MKKYKYLANGRLADVITLIQVLGLIPSDFMEEAEIQEKILKTPSSCKLWSIIATEHPEFFLFEVSHGRIYLLLRYLERSKLSTEKTLTLITAANSLHDKELSQRNKNAYLVPLYISVVSTALSVLSLLYSVNKNEKIIRKAINEELSTFKTYHIDSTSVQYHFLDSLYQTQRK